ncbi:MAG TPA: hypothetical protein VFL59_11645 [Candidatus Nanopelagicales bacterium]|nr:hypothetical protein [Candidatus Nanopelagicales bacterium]
MLEHDHVYVDALVGPATSTPTSTRTVVTAAARPRRRTSSRAAAPGFGTSAARRSSHRCTLLASDRRSRTDRHPTNPDDR